MNQLLALLRILSVGFILFFWSERAFWSFWRPQDSAREMLITWGAYSVLAAIVLHLVRRYHVSRFTSLFIVGAVYGWLAEGGIVDTMYGSASNPFPLSLSFTGLSWHALISVCLGWWWLGRALASGDARASATRSAALGAAWGAWAIWWQSEQGPVPFVSAGNFCLHAAGVGLAFVCAWWLYGRLGPPAGPPSRRETVALGGFVAVFLALARFPMTPLSAAILAPLLLVCAWALRASARAPQEPDVVAQTAVPASPGALATLALIPAAASCVYCAFAWTRLPTNIVLYLITMPLGFWYFGRSLWVERRPVSGADDE